MWWIWLLLCTGPIRQNGAFSFHFQVVFMQRIKQIIDIRQLSAWGREACLMLALAMLMALGWWHTRIALQPGAGLPAGEFSVARALLDLQQIAAAPHPLGTQAHARVRDYLMAQLRAMGLSPQLQSGLATSHDARHGAGWVDNVLVRLPGKQAGRALLLAAHYDSVASANGAADDGVSVAAILETLRVLRAKGPLEHDVMVLFSDGEEAGLFGAELFVREHPWQKDVGLVLNFDNRGNQGPALMFETGPGNAFLIDGLQRAAQPLGSSIMYEIYRHMPNNTDLSVFKAAGLNGMNFGAIEGHMAYHSALDRVELLDPGLLQHQGALILTLARHFTGQAQDGWQATGSNRVYFDFPGLGLVNYPQALVWPLAALVWCGWAGLFWRLSRVNGANWIKGDNGTNGDNGTEGDKGTGETKAARVREPLRWRRVAGAALWFAVLCATLFGLAQGLWWLIGCLHPEYAQLAQGDTYNSCWYLFAWCSLAASAVLLWLGHWASAARAMELGMGAALCWALLLLVLCGYLPGASFVLCWPLLAVMLSWWGWLRGGGRWLLWCGIAPGWLLLTPLVWQMHVALTPQWIGVPVLLLGFYAGLAAPFCAALQYRRGWAGALAGLALLFLVLAEQRAGFDAAHPQQDSLSLIQNSGIAPAHPGNEAASAAPAFWLSSDTVPDRWNSAWLGAGKWQTVPDLYGPRDWPFWVAPATSPNLPPPVATVLQDQTVQGRRRVRLALVSARQAPKVWLALEGGTVYRASINGQMLSNKPERAWTARLYGMPPAGATLELELEPGLPLRLRIIDFSYDLVLAARPPGLIARPYADSDTTRVVRVLSLP
jgi:hypothetical protein